MITAFFRSTLLVGALLLAQASPGAAQEARGQVTNLPPPPFRFA